MLTLKWRQIPPLKGDKGDVIKHFTINITLSRIKIFEFPKTGCCFLRGFYAKVPKV